MADTKTTLNLGVGGSDMDESLVTTTQGPVHRTRTVIGDDTSPTAFVKVLAPSTVPGAADMAAVVALSPNGNQATAAAQAAGNVSLNNIDVNVNSMNNSVAQDVTFHDFSAITQVGYSGNIAHVNGTNELKVIDEGANTKLDTLQALVDGTQITRIADSTGLILADVNGSGNLFTYDAAVEVAIGLVQAAVDNIDAKTPSLGQAAMVASVPVVLASNQSNVPVTGSVTANLGTLNGVALDASVTAMSAKLPASLIGGRLDVNVGAALPTGTNSIGQVTANAGTNLNTSLLATEASLSAQSAKLPASLGPKTSATSLSVTRASDNTLPTSGGSTPFVAISAASTNATNVKSSAGILHGGFITSVDPAVRYLKLFNKSTTPIPGTDSPIHVIAVPGNPAGVTVPIVIPEGLGFTLGIGFALTTGIALLDTGAVDANDHAVNLRYS